MNNIFIFKRPSDYIKVTVCNQIQRGLTYNGFLANQTNGIFENFVSRVAKHGLLRS